jgi:hypothetical protein
MCNRIKPSFPPYHGDPNSITVSQELMQNLVLLMTKVEEAREHERAPWGTPSPPSFSQLQLDQMPHELLLEILLLLPIENLLAMRLVCNPFKDLIDGTPELQVRIAYHLLQKMQPNCYIPLDDLKTDLTQNKLSVEVNNNLCLWKLTQDTSSLPQLNSTVSWINHLIVKNAKPKELTKLFTKLQENKRLLTLYLLNCEVDSEALTFLKLLQIRFADDQKFPIFYFCDLKAIDCELPIEFSTASSNIVLIESNRATAYSIERFLSEESDLIAAREFDLQVQNESSSGELVLKKMEALKSAIKAGIVSSIWHSKLMSQDSLTISKSLMQRVVKAFVVEYPHHPAVRAAAKKNLSILLQSDVFF